MDGEKQYRLSTKLCWGRRQVLEKRLVISLGETDYIQQQQLHTLLLMFISNCDMKMKKNPFHERLWFLTAVRFI